MFSWNWVSTVTGPIAIRDGSHEIMFSGSETMKTPPLEHLVHKG